MDKKTLDNIVNDIISNHIVKNQKNVNDAISKDILEAYNNNPNLSFNELISTLSNAYMYSAVELSVKTTIDILIGLNIIQVKS